MMEQNLQHTIALLTHTPAALNALLRGLPEAWTLGNEGENTMTVFDVVGHLVHAERANWIPRIRTVLEFGDTRPFPAFDRWGHLQASRGKSLADLLDEFAGSRSQSMEALQALNLQPQDMARQGRHPALGVVKLSELLATWAAHDLTHLHQISRIMAHQYREAVGPMSRYLGVLQCAGHGAA